MRSFRSPLLTAFYWLVAVNLVLLSKGFSQETASGSIKEDAAPLLVLDQLVLNLGERSIIHSLIEPPALKP